MFFFIVIQSKFCIFLIYFCQAPVLGLGLGVDFRGGVIIKKQEDFSTMSKMGGGVKKMPEIPESDWLGCHIRSSNFIVEGYRNKSRGKISPNFRRGYQI